MTSDERPAAYARARAADRGLEDLDGAARRLWDGAETPARLRAARDELATFALPFAGRLARQYRDRGEPVEDLEQVARLALVKAVKGYDPERGSFTAYAATTIHGEIKKYFRDCSWSFHVPRRLRDRSVEVRRATALLTSTLARHPTEAELAEELGTTVAEVREAITSTAAYHPGSLNARVGADAAELGELVGERDADLDAVDDHVALTRLLRRLPDRERRMLVMRFYGNRTQAEIAEEFAVSQMHVSRLLGRALGWLRHALLTDNPPPWPPRDEWDSLSVEQERQGPTVVLRVRGEVDVDCADRLRRGLVRATAVAGISRVDVDLHGVPLLDVAGVNALVAGMAAARTAGVGIRVLGAQPYVRRVLALTGLGPHLVTE
ncbi:sigma-70 family RNA polymerase sigma factor [Asanoa sp. WMMD1127]|uniref:sigma-70 family RNA polymerase sigma factor n=1 Tax=Asanoa sp. WMMD1127 TaxID=3016107 RepID=UPI002417C561|nr:sigma-70 family RNA polymerase sigma factor [Asanoa sp. WMMD1127]MDG4824569.1 sigma-70 family RNA polymerase sigma factor [Asanoa sp. WMMD1127]